MGVANGHAGVRYFIQAAAITESSGNLAYDNSVVEALRAAAPYNLPRSLFGTKGWVELTLHVSPRK